MKIKRAEIKTKEAEFERFKTHALGFTEPFPVNIFIESRQANRISLIMKNIFVLYFALSLLTKGHASPITYVTIGDPGNPPDSSGKGSVPYNYSISQTEIPISEYVKFLNAVAASDPNGVWTSSVKYISRSGSDGSFHYSTESIWENKPVMVDITRILRFINWLHNGQPTGSQSSSTTEDGAYTFYGKVSYSLRNARANYWMPNENEWRKAAFYDPITRTHRIYPHGSDTPVTAIGDANGDVVNPSSKTYAYGKRNWGANISAPFSVGTSGSHSPWGVSDQGGNLWEVFEPTQPGQIDFKGYGGAFNTLESDVAVLKRTFAGANFVGQGYNFGIRVAKAVDEYVDLEKADDDGDGITNYNELRLGTNPSVSNQELFEKIKQNSNLFGLYSESEIMNFSLDGITCRVNDAVVTIRANVLESEDLTHWTKSGEMSLQLPLIGDYKFYRLMIDNTN